MIKHPGSNKKYIFDVCGTLFPDDTTAGLLRWHFRDSGWRSALLGLVFRRTSPINFLVRVVERLSGRHLVKHLALLMLRGQSVEAVADSAQSYLDWLLRERPTSVLARLSEVREEGWVVLASASIEPIILALATRLDVEYVSSQLGTQNGSYTGLFEKDLSGKKVGELLHRFGTDFFDGELACYTDNLSDMELLERCQERYVVLREPGHRRRWNLEGAIFIENQTRSS